MYRIAYLSSTFPALSTTFVQYEVRTLEKLGLEIVLTANRAPLLGRYHPKDNDLIGRTFYLTPINPFRYLKANFNFFIKSPRRYLRVLKLAFSLNDNFPRQRLKNLARMAGAAVLAERVLKKHVCHVHVHFAFGAAGVAIFLEALSGIPYSLSIHGSDVLLPQPLTEEKLKRAKFIVSNCRFHVDNLRELFPSLYKKPFYVVRLGLDIHSKIWSKAEPSISNSPLRILNVARLDPVKAHHVLIKACAHLMEKGIPFYCKIVGDGPSRSQIESLIAKLGLNDSIELMGFRYESEVSELFNWAHVMVLSSLSEGTPMTAIEAMAKGRVVIAPRITALHEMIDHGHNGLLFEPGRSDELADCLSQLARQPELRNRMGVAGRAKAEELFDLSTNVLRLMAIFAQEIPELDIGNKMEVQHA